MCDKINVWLYTQNSMYIEMFVLLLLLLILDNQLENPIMKNRCVSTHDNGINDGGCDEDDDIQHNHESFFYHPNWKKYSQTLFHSLDYLCSALKMPLDICSVENNLLFNRVTTFQPLRWWWLYMYTLYTIHTYVHWHDFFWVYIELSYFVKITFGHPNYIKKSFSIQNAIIYLFSLYTLHMDDVFFIFYFFFFVVCKNGQTQNFYSIKNFIHDSLTLNKKQKPKFNTNKCEMVKRNFGLFLYFALKSKSVSHICM